jgi:hypothetical protein
MSGEASAVVSEDVFTLVSAAILQESKKRIKNTTNMIRDNFLIIFVNLFIFKFL